MSSDDSGARPAAEATAQSVGAEGAAKRPSNAWKWWIAVVLFLATVLTYLDRQTLSLCGPKISDELHLNKEQYGRLVAAFRWTYALMHIPAGFLADRFPLRPMYALAVLAWSAAGAAASFVGNMRQLLLTRGLLGVGEAFNWPCATRIVANMLPPEDRGLASGIFNSGAAAGSLLAPFIILPLAEHYGWRSAFLVVGGIGLLWVVLWMAATRRRLDNTSPTRQRGKSRGHGHDLRALLAPRASVLSGGIRVRALTLAAWSRQVLLHPAFWMLLLIGVSVNPCWYFLNDWMPTYLHDQRGMSQLTAGMLSTPVFLAADLGNLASGGLVKGLTLWGWSLRKARGTTIALAALLIVPVAFMPAVGNAYVAIAMLAAAAFGINSVLANYTACQQDFSFANVGIVAGILGMACNVFAAVVNPLIGGYVDRTGHYTLIFTLMALLPLVGLAAILVYDALIWRNREVGLPASDVDIAETQRRGEENAK